MDWRAQWSWGTARVGIHEYGNSGESEEVVPEHNQGSWQWVSTGLKWVEDLTQRWRSHEPKIVVWDVQEREGCRRSRILLRKPRFSWGQKPDGIFSGKVEKVGSFSPHCRGILESTVKSTTWREKWETGSGEKKDRKEWGWGPRRG